MVCPECKKGMIALELEEVEIDYCLSCGGIWLDSGELELLLEGADGKDVLLSTFVGGGTGKKRKGSIIKTEKGDEAEWRGRWEEKGDQAERGESGREKGIIERSRRCPICLRRMEKILCGMDDQKIRIDKCKRNEGYWFDRGELEAVLRMGTFGKESRVLNLLQEMFGGQRN